MGAIVSIFAKKARREARRLQQPQVVVEVNRSIKSTTYPSLAEKIVFPEFECSGPLSYSPQDVGWYRTTEGFVAGEVLSYLNYKGFLRNCFKIQDGYAFQEGGVEVFREFFGDVNVNVLLFGSVVKDINGKLFSPLMYTDSTSVFVEWFSLEHVLESVFLIPYFK
jgi:hypothetical protein